MPQDRPALWLLRTEAGMLRTLTDSAGTVFPLQRTLLPFEERYLAQSKDAEMSAMYLFLKPGLIVPENQYAYSSLPIQMVDLGGWMNFLKVDRTVYLEASAYGQGQMSLVAASFNRFLSEKCN